MLCLIVADRLMLFSSLKKEEMDGLPGYLSLHINPSNNLLLKWTPNQLMNGSTDETTVVRSKKYVFLNFIECL
jgi:hypothetical protein